MWPRPTIAKQRLESIAQTLGLTVADLIDHTPASKVYEQTDELHQLWELLGSDVERETALGLIRHLVQERR